MFRVGKEFQSYSGLLAEGKKLTINCLGKPAGDGQTETEVEQTVMSWKANVLFEGSAPVGSIKWEYEHLSPGSFGSLCVLLKTTKTRIETKERETRSPSYLGLVVVEMKSIISLQPPSNSPKSKANRHRGNQMKGKNNIPKPQLVSLSLHRWHWSPTELFN